MPYEWDESKRIETLEIRGVDFAEIYDFDWDTAVTRRSDRNDEERRASLGMIGTPVSCSMDLARRKQANHQPAKGEQTGEQRV